MMSYALYRELKNLWESIMAKPGETLADPAREVPDRASAYFANLPQKAGLYFPPKTGKKLRPRDIMPQIKGKFHQDFFDWLRKKGIEVWEDEVLPGDLHPSQQEIDLTKVAKYINDPEGTNLLGKRIIVTKDNQILDGHHHWLARLKAYPDQPMPVWRIGKKLKKAYKLAWKFPKTYASGVKPVQREWHEVAEMIELDECDLAD